MELELAAVLSCTETGCRVRCLDSDLQVEARYAEPMVEHEIAARPGQLVALQRDADVPTVVYLWTDVAVAEGDAGYRLTQCGDRLDPDQLRAAAFPQIRALYERLGQARTIDPKRVVQEGYDRIAERYLDWVQTERSAVRMRYTAVLLERLAPGATVLDLGCGAGGPTTQALSQRFQVTGVDISAHSVALARENVTRARFLQADMTTLELAPCSFDGVAAFYSLIHVPRDEQPGLLRRIASWLRPGGLLVATMGVHATQADYGPDFMGAPMYWSGFDSATNCRLVEDAGLAIIHAQEEAEEEHGDPVIFFWIIAQKPTAFTSNLLPHPGIKTRAGACSGT